MTLLKLHGLVAGYDGSAVVRGIDLSVEDGQVVALLGANGAGKTTTLLALSGLVRATSGTIDVLGRRVRAGRTHQLARQGMIHVPEGRSVFPGLTVRQNLTLARASRSGVLDHVLSFFPELEPHLGRRAGMLSGGEQQMLALGRALACRPRLLIIDELSLGLAPIIVRRQLTLLRRIAAETGAGVLFVEQHVSLALEVADLAHVMARGQLLMSGSGAELARRWNELHTGYLGQAPTSIV